MAADGAVRTLHRALDVLSCLAAERGPLGPSEISRRTGIDRATVYRMLQSLSVRKLAIASQQAGRYVLGPGLLALAEGVPDNQIQDLAVPHLERLRDLSGESAVLSVLSQNRCTHISVEPSRHRVRWNAEIGASVPLYAGAAGKAILAFMPASELERAYAEAHMPSYGHLADAARQQARAEIPLIRETGYAVAVQELSADATGIAAPVFDRSRAPVASLGICGPTSRFTGPELERAKNALLRAASALSAQLGYDAQ
ncbi:MAG: IclR family transcriptional regulator [Rhizobiaceae bacterium]|nr:IclR family transcriptional regulator [Rhizobiaceae bacterium]